MFVIDTYCRKKLLIRHPDVDTIKTLQVLVLRQTRHKECRGKSKSTVDQHNCQMDCEGPVKAPPFPKKKDEEHCVAKI